MRAVGKRSQIKTILVAGKLRRMRTVRIRLPKGHCQGSAFFVQHAHQNRFTGLHHGVLAVVVKLKMVLKNIVVHGERTVLRQRLTFVRAGAVKTPESEFLNFVALTLLHDVAREHPHHFLEDVILTVFGLFVTNGKTRGRRDERKHGKRARTPKRHSL